ncbi:MAG: hypothetical protein JST65_24390 [Acidobacteria bacterium]|nr:hypothetical protein [Acidobacteriota bacterium]
MRRWIDLAGYAGPNLPDADVRIARLVELWNSPIPGFWMREDDCNIFPCVES